MQCNACGVVFGVCHFPLNAYTFSQFSLRETVNAFGSLNALRALAPCLYFVAVVLCGCVKENASRLRYMYAARFQTVCVRAKEESIRLQQTNRNVVCV